LIERERERERERDRCFSLSLSVDLSLTIELVGGARERDPDDERYDYFSLEDDDDFLLRAVVDFSSSPFISWFKRRAVGRTCPSEEFTFAGIGRW